MIDAENVKLHVSQDKLCVFVAVEDPKPGQRVESKDIMSALVKKGVVYGILDGEIKRIADDQIYGADILVAQGTTATHGTDGYVEYLFSLDNEKSPKVLEDGKVDYYDMNIVHPVNKDEVLCRLSPPKSGKDGRNVYGDTLLAKNGKPALLPRGRNTQPNGAGDELLASIDGQIKRNGKNVEIVQELEIKDNVDFSTGNIRFPGSVTVRGNVLSGFTIQSGGDVAIHGFVEKANITAVGDIVLHGGMNGQGAGTLRAGGNIFAKYVENSHIAAGGKITAECVMHSAVRAGVGIELLGKKGLFVGGSAKSREYVKAVTIGSQFATLTEIEVGSDPKLNDRLSDIKAEINALDTEHKKIELTLQAFDKAIKSGVELSPQKALMHDRTLKVNGEQAAKLAALRDEYDYLENAVKKNLHGYVRVSNVIYSGVKISITGNNLFLKEDLQYCTLKSDEDGIRVSPY